MSEFVFYQTQISMSQSQLTKTIFTWNFEGDLIDHQPCFIPNFKFLAVQEPIFLEPKFGQNRLLTGFCMYIGQQAFLYFSWIWLRDYVGLFFRCFGLPYRLASPLIYIPITKVTQLHLPITKVTQVHLPVTKVTQVHLPIACMLYGWYSAEGNDTLPDAWKHWYLWYIYIYIYIYYIYIYI